MYMYIYPRVPLSLKILGGGGRAPPTLPSKSASDLHARRMLKPIALLLYFMITIKVGFFYAKFESHAAATDISRKKGNDNSTAKV